MSTSGLTSLPLTTLPASRPLLRFGKMAVQEPAVQGQVTAPAPGAMDQVTLSGGVSQTVSPPQPRSISHPSELKFVTEPDAGKTAVYLTSEVAIPGYPSSGGLGIVSAQTGSALNTYHGKDVRVLLPANAIFEQKIKDPKEGWQDSGEEIKLPVPWKDYQKDYAGDPEATFHVYQKHFDDYNLWVYALTSHSKLLNPFEYGANTPNNYVGVSDIPNAKVSKNYMGVYTKDLQDGTNQVMLLCDQAMAVLSNRLDPTRYQPSAGSHLKQFDQKLDHWIVNDWITGPADCMPEVPKDVGITFITHNTYDKTVPEAAAKAFHLPSTSMLRSAIEKADVVIVNDDFLRTITQTQFLDRQGREAVKKTFQQLNPDNTSNMHHGYGDEFNPFGNPVLAGSVALEPKIYNNKQWIAKHAARNQVRPMPLPQSNWQFRDLQALPPASGVTIEQKPQAPLAPVIIPIQPTVADRWMQALKQVFSVLTLGLYRPESLSRRMERLNLEQVAKAQVTHAQATERANQNYAQVAERTISSAEASHLLQWKQQQKQALQHWLGMKPDPQAVMFTSSARLDVAQKMGNVVMNTLIPFMEKNPHAQFVGCFDYDGNNPAINQQLRAAADRFPDRFKILTFNVNVQKLVSAGGDYSVMPSAYEPYGTGQLQANALACIPICNDVDGLHQTVSDPAMNQPYLRQAGEPDHPKVWDYGQTGLFTHRIMGEDWMKVCKQLDFVLPGQVKDGDVMSYEWVSQHLPPAEKKTWVTAHEGFRQSLERAYDLSRNHPDQMALMMKNGQDFVFNEHNWQSISSRYLPAMEKAMAMAAQRSQQSDTSANG